MELLLLGSTSRRGCLRSSQCRSAGRGGHQPQLDVVVTAGTPRRSSLPRCWDERRPASSPPFSLSFPHSSRFLVVVAPGSGDRGLEGDGVVSLSPAGERVWERGPRSAIPISAMNPDVTPVRHHLDLRREHPVPAAAPDAGHGRGGSLAGRGTTLKEAVAAAQHEVPPAGRASRCSTS